MLLSDGKSTTGRSDEEAIAAAKSRPGAGVDHRLRHRQRQRGERRADRAGPVDATALEAIAKGTDGKFFAAASADELRTVYADINAEVTVVAIDRGVAEWFAAAALILLLVASLTSMLRTGRVVWT